MKIFIDGQLITVSKHDYKILVALAGIGVKFTLKKPKKHYKCKQD